MKKVLRVSVFSILIPVIFICSACNLFVSEDKGSTADSSLVVSHTDPITEINNVYKGTRMNAAAFDIRAFKTPELRENQILVIMGFSIENASSSEKYMVDSGSYEVYIDNVVATKDYLIGINEHLNSCYLAPGKTVKGYWGAIIPASAKSMEVLVEDDRSAKKYATFILDVPPVESITLDEYFASID